MSFQDKCRIRILSKRHFVKTSCISDELDECCIRRMYKTKVALDELDEGCIRRMVFQIESFFSHTTSMKRPSNLQMEASKILEQL